MSVYLALSIMMTTASSADACDLPVPEDHVETFHGVEVPDPFRALEQPGGDLLNSWAGCEDKRTRNHISGLKSYEAVATRLSEVEEYSPALKTPRSVPEGLFFLTRVNGERGVFLRRAEGDSMTPVLLEQELETWGILQAGEVIREFEPSPDGRFVAFGIGAPSSNWAVWYLVDLERKALVGEPIEGFHHFYNQLVWRPDSSGFFYGRFRKPPAGGKVSKPEGFAVYERALGETVADTETFTASEGDSDIYRVAVEDDGAALILTSSGLNQNRVLRLRKSEDEWRQHVLFEGEEERFFYAGSNEGRLFFGTSAGAERRRIISVDPLNADRAHWREIVGEADGMTLESLQLLGGKLVAVYLKDAVRKLRLFDLEGSIIETDPFPYIGWVVSRQSTGFWDSFAGSPTSEMAYFTINGQADPGSLYQLDVSKGKIVAISRPKLAFEPGGFVTKQVFYDSHDGTRVPMYIVHKEGLDLEAGNHPVWLYAYGFNWSSVPYFMPEIIPWMERGGIYAFPGVRGGAEYGQPWIEGGSGRNTINKIKDYVWAAKHLVETGMTREGLVIANGGSSSGPLPAAAINMAPRLFAAAVIDIPLLDMVGMFNHLNGVITSGWGNIDNKEDFMSLMEWSPYQNLTGSAGYPPTYVYVGEKDEFAPPMHGLKYVAKRRLIAPEGANSVWLDVGEGAGHYIDKEALIGRLVFALDAVSENR